MNTEQARLERMLKENKISQQDYNTLLVALEKKSFFSRMESSLLLNPFQKIAGGKALVIGMMILVAMSYIGVIAKVYFIGPLTAVNYTILTKQTMDIGFLLLAYQNIICWLVLSALFVIAAKILQKKKLRIIDFLGTVSLARFPLLLLTIIMSIIRQVSPAMLDIDMTKGIPLHYASSGEYVLNAIVAILLVWQIITYFYAMKESSGLVGKKLWLGFIVPVIAGELIALPLTSLFMN